MTDSQTEMPLVSRLRACSQQPHAAFHTPGHKRGQGVSPLLKQWLGSEMFRADLPELPELDNLFAPQGVIQAAQALAAAAFGAEQTWFLANGSTCGIEAAVLATCNPGDKIVLPRNAHQSAIAALILSGAMPLFVEPDYDPIWGIPFGVAPATIEATLAAHADVRAVMLVYPTYHGICSDIAAIASITHRYNVPLLVDEAHGAHFHFHPDLPTSALTAGADLTIQSTHKVLGAMTQAAMLHVQGERINRERLGRALQLVQSTSPNYLLLASLDAARQQMAVQGKELVGRSLVLAEQARQGLRQIAGLQVFEAPCLSSAQPAGFAALDATRLTVDVTGLGLTGFAADDQLHQQWRVTAELAAFNALTLIITFGNTPTDIEQLVQSFQALADQYGVHHGDRPLGQPIAYGKTVMTPRDAFFAATETVAIAASIGRISGELVCPYPPGIPVLLPGEQIFAEAIASLQNTLKAGGIVSGCADVTLSTLQVVV